MLRRVTDTARITESLSADHRTVKLIGAASALGCPIPGAEQAPAHLQQQGLTDSLQARGITAHWHSIIKAPPAHSSPCSALAQFCPTLSQEVAGLVADQQFFTVIGGDHTCAIGTWSGVYQAFKTTPFGLIWVDAHMDSHTPATSHTGALHGMPVACLLGSGPAELRLAQPGPALLPQHLCLIGIRSFEAEEAALLNRLGVRIFYMEEIRRRGMPSVMAEALIIVNRGTGGFGVSIDLDAIDPQLAPGVSTPAANGLLSEELAALLRPLPSAAHFIGLEIAEYNPLHDSSNKTLQLINTILTNSIPIQQEAIDE